MKHLGKRRAWKPCLAFMAVFGGHAGMALIYDALPPVLVQLSRHYGGGTRGEVIAQFASSLPYFGVMIAGLITAYPVRKWGIRNVLVTALVLFGLLGSAGALIDGAELLLLTRFLLGFAEGMMVTCCVSYVALNFDESQRARMMGWLLAFGCMCGVLFILISGLVASRFGWRAPFYLHGAVSLIFVVLALCMERGIVPQQSDKPLSDLLGLRPVAPVFAVAIVLQALVGTFLIQLAFLVGHLPFGSPNAIAMIFAVLGSASTASSYSYARWLTRISPPLVVGCGFGIVAIGIIIAAIATSFGTFFFAVLIFGAGSALTQAALFTWAMRRSTPNLVTNAMGLMFTCLYFGTAAGPALAAPLPGMLGIRSLFILIVIGIVVGLLIVGAIALSQRRRGKEAS